MKQYIADAFTTELFHGNPAAVCVLDAWIPDPLMRQIAAETLDWSEEQFDEEGELLTRANMASICLKHLEDWGWLRRDYDETMDSYVVSFPEYSQMFVELFVRLLDRQVGA